MIRRALAGALLMLVSVGVGNAEAQWWAGWLDRLSGPGRFSGQGIFVEFLCYGEKRDTPSGARELFVDLDCSRVKPRTWKAVIGFETAWYTADQNPLTYTGEPSNDLKQVTLRTLVPTVDFAPASWIELGAGIGIAWFDGELFATTSKLMIEPIRVTIKPLTLIFADFDERKPGLGILQFRLQGTTFPGGFDAADFGAIPGSWRVGTELLPSFHVVLDFQAWLARRGR
jgi:hypothetical protein